MANPGASICDEELGRRAAGNALLMQNPNSVSVGNFFQVAAGSLSSVAAAQAAVASQAAGTTANVSISVCDRHLATSAARAYQIASNLGTSGCMTGSSYTTLYAGLPSSAGHPRNILPG